MPLEIPVALATAATASPRLQHEAGAQDADLQARMVAADDALPLAWDELVSAQRQAGTEIAAAREELASWKSRP